MEFSTKSITIKIDINQEAQDVWVKFNQATTGEIDMTSLETRVRGTLVLNYPPAEIIEKILANQKIQDMSLDEQIEHSKDLGRRAYESGKYLSGSYDSDLQDFIKVIRDGLERARKEVSTTFINRAWVRGYQTAARESDVHITKAVKVDTPGGAMFLRSAGDDQGPWMLTRDRLDAYTFYPALEVPEVLVKNFKDKLLPVWREGRETRANHLMVILETTPKK